MTSILSLSEIATLDRHIEQLNNYKPIAENEVKVLCDKVSKTINAFELNYGACVNTII